MERHGLPRPEADQDLERLVEDLSALTQIIGLAETAEVVAVADSHAESQQAQSSISQ